MKTLNVIGIGLITATVFEAVLTGIRTAVFAAMLNTSLSTVQKWEIGQKRPTGAALKLLHLVQTKGLKLLFETAKLAQSSQ